MRVWTKVLLVALFVTGLTTILWLLSAGHTFAVLQPHGQLAQRELDLLIFAVLLSLLVVVPVFVLTAVIVYRFRESNTRATYKPNWEHNQLAELSWWGIPIVLISILAVVTWNSTHALDPYKPLASSVEPLTVQVVALNWKWLFIYPELGVASVGSMPIPINRPINLQITADAPMNSFWVPQLSGQIYAMPGMSTRLHLNATAEGTYRGSSANLSGNGFAGMTFTAKALAQSDFDDWVAHTQTSTNLLTQSTYEQLAQPSTNAVVTNYYLATPDLYDRVIMKYMAPMGGLEMMGMHHG